MPKSQAPRSTHHATSNTYRFFVPAATLQGKVALIDDPTLAHQMAHVLRLRPEMEITLLDNSGWEHIVRLERVERKSVSGAVIGRQLATGEPGLKLTLYASVLRGERFEWILQKGTELGVSVFVPVVCERSIVDDAAEIGASKLDRWERIIREAAEQSRRARLPKLQPAQLFAPACGHAARRARALLLWEGSGAVSLRQALRQKSADSSGSPLSIALFSGPEGGFTESELATAIMYNIDLVSLGPRILRAETAPIAAASVVFYEHGDLD